MLKQLILKLSKIRGVIKLIEYMLRARSTDIGIYWKHINVKSGFWEFAILDYKNEKILYDSDKK